MFFSDLEKKILKQRNLLLDDEIHRFIYPDYEKDQHDPFLLPDMDKACERIEKAIQNNEKITIYGDYDADGISATTIMVRFFEAIGITVNTYIPKRNIEGFGLNMQSAQLISKSSDLIITVDCGSVDIEPAYYLYSEGVDLIITDHHHVSEERIECIALINPQRKDSTYPFKGLSGSGVAWKLVTALLSRNRYHLLDGWEKWLLGMVAIGTVCDMMPMVDENRALVKFGLISLSKLQWVGIKDICKVASIHQSFISVDDIGFSIGPRINAASRMGNAYDALILFTTNNPLISNEKATLLETLNTERKVIVRSMRDQAIPLIEGSSIREGVIVIGYVSWQPSLVGLVASSVADTYGIPTFIWGKGDGDLIKGSCRSGGKKSVVEIMRACGNGIFEHFGGHTHAGGFALYENNLEQFQKRLIEVIDTIPPLVEDSVFAPLDVLTSELTPSLYNVTQLLSPFGTDNPVPQFILKGNVMNVRSFGKESLFTRGDLDDGFGTLPVISFNEAFPLKEGMMTLQGEYEKNDFNGKSEYRFKVLTYRK